MPLKPTSLSGSSPGPLSSYGSSSSCLSDKRKSLSASMMTSKGVVPPSARSIVSIPRKISVVSLKLSINRFSTVSVDIPIALNSAAPIYTQRINAPCFSTRFENARVSAPVKSCLRSVSFGLSSISEAGKRRKDIRNAKQMPIAIIQPKSMTGRIPLNSSDPNATIVVNAV